MDSFTVSTRSRTDLPDITGDVAEIVRRKGVRNGVCVVSVPHTTAGVTINENADPTVRDDIAAILDRLIPWDGPYTHAEGNSAAHVKTALVGNSCMVPIEDGRLALGTWQGIYFCEFDGPRSRRCNVQVLAEA